MQNISRKLTKAIPVDLIAPCGMNCRLCHGFIREKNTCPGCRNIDSQGSQQSKFRSSCRLRNCEHPTRGKSRFCSESCSIFPCARLKQLDKRYSTKYGMSMIENLIFIQESGIRNFIRKEREKWICPECGDLICVHRPTCLSCGYRWN